MGIPRDEFQHRIQSVQRQMAAVGLDALLVYGDEYRKENLRYVSNYWPIFERGSDHSLHRGCYLVGCP